MNVSKLSVKNYRNLKEDSINLGSKVNIIYGKNAQGKTNIIEALWLLTGGKSFRGNKDIDLIAFGERYAEIEGVIKLSDREIKIKIRISQEKRTAEINEINRGTAASIIGQVKSVIFSPEHLCLVKGGPESRRKFIDAAICQLKPTYLSLFMRYNKILKQRNALLKDISKNFKLKDTLNVWDIKTSECAGSIVWERLKYLREIKEKATIIYSNLSGKENLEIKYKNQEIFSKLTVDEIKKALLLDIENTRDLDINRGFTSVGPHRDDVLILINGKPAKFFASQGQQRSAVVALKLSEAEIIKEVTGENPIVLLDDIMSELDEKRQEYMFKNTNLSQTIITGCIKPNKSKYSNYKAFKVINGQIFQE